jgi:oligopeptide transport system permease protein
MDSMPRLVIRRLLMAIPVLWLVCTATFFALRVVPGGPYDREKELPAAVLANLASRQDLDQPVFVQYVRYLGRTATLDLDYSMKYPNQSVAGIVSRALPISVLLGGLAAVIALLGGLTAGVVAAMRPGGALDRVIQVATAAAFALPTFVVGTGFVLLFAMRLRWLPPALLDGPAHVVLPVLTLALGPAAYIASLTRAGVISQLREQYVQAARARGASTGRALVVHALRNALGPVVAVMGTNHCVARDGVICGGAHLRDTGSWAALRHSGDRPRLPARARGDARLRSDCARRESGR